MQPGTNILGIKSSLPIRWASPAPRIVVGSQESRDPFPGDLVRARRRDAGQSISLARSGIFLRSLCARDPIPGGKQSRNLICPGSGTQPTPEPSDRWPESLEEERLSRITGPSRSLLRHPVQVLKHCRLRPLAPPVPEPDAPRHLLDSEQIFSQEISF